MKDERVSFYNLKNIIPGPGKELDDLIHQGCDEGVNLVPRVVSAEEEKTCYLDASFDAHLRYGLAYCRFSGASSTTQPRDPFILREISDNPVEQLLQDGFPSAFVTSRGIESFLRVVECGWRDMFLQDLESALLRYVRSLLNICSVEDQVPSLSKVDIPFSPLILLIKLPPLTMVRSAWLKNPTDGPICELDMVAQERVDTDEDSSK